MDAPLHPNVALLNKLFTALDAHDHAAMASCYHPDAHFRDIAFDQDGIEEIRLMWRMICSTDIRVKFEVVDADDHSGRARLIDTYHFGASKDPPDPGRRVVNAIDSRFRFEDGLIRRHEDDCDARDWARQAVGGIAGFLAGRIRFLRSSKAKAKLAAFAKAPAARG